MPNHWAQWIKALNVKEADNDPLGAVNTLIMPNGSLTDNGNGEYQVNKLPGAAGGIDGPNVSAYNSFLKHVWTLNDAGGPIDDSIGAAPLTVNGSPTFLKSGADALLTNAIEINTPGTDYFSRAAGFGHGTDKGYSINVYFKLNNVGSGSRGIWSFGNASADRIELSIDASDQLLFFSRSVNLNKFLAASAPQTWNTSTWYMATVTVSTVAAAEVATVYLNGVQVASDTEQNVATAFVDASIRPFALGLRQSGSDAFDAIIDETQYWFSDADNSDEATLSPNAVQDLWNSGNGLSVVS